MALPDALPSQAASTECGETAPLTPSELNGRLRLGDASLVEELHPTALRRIAFETELGARIEQWAPSLIGPCGIAVTVALGVNGLQLKSIDEPTVLSSACGCVALAFVAAITLGVASTVFALLATRVRERRICVNERDVFHDAELRAAEASAPSERTPPSPATVGSPRTLSGRLVARSPDSPRRRRSASTWPSGSSG